MDFDRPEKWYSVKEVAYVLGVSRDTVMRQIRAGYLRAFQLPCKSSNRRRVYRTYRVRGSDLLAHVETGMVDARQ